MHDAWNSGDPYDYFMGRWSRRVAQSFLQWLSPKANQRWLNVGCGSGALSETAANDYNPSRLMAIDQSAGFVETTRKRLGSDAICRVGDALALPLNDTSVEISVAGLLLNFLPEPEGALSEMRRVTIPGGTVAVYIWDYPGRMEFLQHFWDAAVELDPGASDKHESRRFPNATRESLAAELDRAGLDEIATTAIDIDTPFTDFQDYWQPFLGGQGPAPTYVQSLDPAARKHLQAALEERLPFQADGSLSLRAHAWAARGQTPACPPLFSQYSCGAP